MKVVDSAELHNQETAKFLHVRNRNCAKSCKGNKRVDSGLSKQVTSPVSAEIEEGFAKNTFLKFHVQNNC